MNTKYHHHCEALTAYLPSQYRKLWIGTHKYMRPDHGFRYIILLYPPIHPLNSIFQCYKEHMGHKASMTVTLYPKTTQILDNFSKKTNQRKRKRERTVKNADTTQIEFSGELPKIGPTLDWGPE